MMNKTLDYSTTQQLKLL